MSDTIELIKLASGIFCIGVIGVGMFIGYALCRAAGRADRQMEQLTGQDYSG